MKRKYRPCARLMQKVDISILKYTFHNHPLEQF